MLTKAQKKQFHEEGYVKIAGAVPRVMVDAARRAINHSLGYVGLPPDQLEKYRAQSYCEELRNQAVLTDLFNRTPLMGAAESLMGPGNVLPVGGVQIALRFPSPPGEDPREPRGHLDGLGSGTNGMAKGVYRRGFTALCVVTLQDVPEPYSGNFTVWPKSHRFFESYFRANGHAMLAEGMPKVELPEGGVMITAQAGDAVITHHALVHSAAPNASPDVRYAAITRLRHVDCQKNGVDVYTDIWREWPGVAEAVATP